MKGKLVISGILVAVIAVVYFSFLYPWPGTSDVLGTIGGVKKYNSQQISDKDVQLNEHMLTDGSQADPVCPAGQAGFRLPCGGDGEIQSGGRDDLSSGTH